jgi:general stress protein 26
MTSDADIEQKFWKELKDSPFVMLGIEGEHGSATQPMTAQFQGEAAPLWFFTARDNGLVQALGSGSDRAIAAFASKGHDLFASIRGQLSIDNDPAMIERLWNPVIAQWYQGGKSDPKLALLRLDVEDAKLWKSDVGAFMHPVINKLLGRKPEAGERENVAEVSL